MDPTANRPWARFDDLRSGEALLCPTPDRVLTTTRWAEVAGVLQQVHDATAAGSWAYGFVSYEAASGLDPRLPGGWTPGQPPLVWFGLCTEPARVDPLAGSGLPTAQTAPWRPDWTAAAHGRAVETVREHIAAGETYQCNLTDRLRSTVTGDPEALYSRLALAQRGAHNAYLDLGRHVVASASPELFFEWVGDEVRPRPMKGTAPRGRTTAEDEEQSRALRASAKEQAENVMIVDLLRNDLSRVAEVGSVTVQELLALERYPTVWQMTSQISARVRPDVGLPELFGALFPCGSVTGAPKQRTMQLIRELEQAPRGVYCGAIGLVAPPSAPFRARFSVAIRTVVVDRASGEAVYGAGGGITWRSDPARERAELLAKAAVLAHDTADHQLVETLACLPGGGPRNLDRHLARLADSAAYFGFRFDRDALPALIADAVAGRADPARVRVVLDRSGDVAIEVGDMPAASSGPVRLVVEPEPVDAASPWLQHKTTRRDAYRVRALRHREADDVVLVNQRGELTETTIANLAVRLDGRWWTPPTASGCLPGVERGRLLDLGRLRERVLHVDDLAAADGLAVLSSLRGWRAAELIRPAERPGRAGAPLRPIPLPGRGRGHERDASRAAR